LNDVIYLLLGEVLISRHSVLTVADEVMFLFGCEDRDAEVLSAAAAHFAIGTMTIDAGLRIDQFAGCNRVGRNRGGINRATGLSLAVHFGQSVGGYDEKYSEGGEGLVTLFESNHRQWYRTEYANQFDDKQEVENGTREQHPTAGNQETDAKQYFNNARCLCIGSQLLLPVQ